MQVTKERLDAALKAWEVARERSMLEQQAWGTLTQSHGSLISSLRAHGHNWNQAEAEFEKLSNDHRDRLLSAWADMDRLCGEYQKLHAAFKKQSSSPTP
jgi:hypothetical protein